MIEAAVKSPLHEDLIYRGEVKWAIVGRTMKSGERVSCAFVSVYKTQYFNCV